METLGNKKSTLYTGLILLSLSSALMRDVVAQNVNQSSNVDQQTITSNNGYNAATAAEVTATQATGGQLSSLYSTSVQANLNVINPMTAAQDCPNGSISTQPVLSFNATNSATGSPDQFAIIQCANSASGGLYSTSTLGNVNVLNPIGGQIGCSSGYTPSPALTFTANNPKNGNTDTFTLSQCTNSSSGGFYSVSNQGNVNQVNPVTGAMTCPFPHNPFLVVTFNATNPTTNTPDQYNLFQCL